MLVARSLGLLAVLQAVACGPEAAPAVRTVPAPSAPAPTPAPHTAARWLFQGRLLDSEHGVVPAPGGELHFGAFGRRALVASGKVTAAESVADAKLVDARDDGARWTFVDTRGRAYTSEGPLGALVPAGPPPKDMKGGALGKEAIFAFGARELHRSLDGKRFEPVSLPLRPLERIRSVGANRRGEVLITLAPQRALLSVDDGKTFTQVPSIALLGDVVRDANGELHVGPARLASGKFVPANPLVDHSPVDVPGRVVHMEALYGDRFLRLVRPLGSELPTELEIGRLGQVPPAYVPVPKDVTVTGVGGYEHQLYLAVDDSNGARVLRSDDGGSTFVSLIDVPGATTRQVLAGPDGAFAVTTCQAKCTTTVTAHGKQWVLPELNLGRAGFDAAEDSLWGLAVAPNAKGSAHHDVHVVALKTGAVRTLTALVGTTVIAATRTRAGSFLLIDRHGRCDTLTADGNESSSYLPFEGEGTSVALVGDRGVALSWADGIWETADAGAHWTQRPMGAHSERFACTSAGCAIGSGIFRVGWDLPEGTTTGLAAGPKPYPKQFDPDPPEPRRISCHTSGKTTKLPDRCALELRRTSGTAEATCDVSSGDPESPLSVSTVARDATTKSFTLLPARAQNKAFAMDVSSATSDYGVLAVRYRYAIEKKNGQYSPVEEELGYLPFATGKVVHLTLPNPKPFRLGQTARPWTPTVAGGVYLLPQKGDVPLAFVSNTGKVKTWPRPSTGLAPNGARSGDAATFVLGYQGGASLRWTSDHQSWTAAEWMLLEYGELVQIGATPHLVLTDGGQPYGLLPLSTPSPDAPAITPFTQPASPLAPCGKDDVGGVLETTTVSPSLRLEIDGESYLEHKRLLRIRSDGTSCVDRVVLQTGADGARRVVLHADDLAHGWSDRDGVVQAVTCQP